MNEPNENEAAFGEMAQVVPEPTPLHVRDVVDATAAALGLSAQALLGDSRAQPVTEARHIAMYLARRYVKLSYPALGRVFRRDHSTVQHGCNQITDRLATDTRLAVAVREIERRLTEGAPFDAAPLVTLAPVAATVVPVKLCVVVCPDGSYVVYGSSRLTAEQVKETARADLRAPSTVSIHEVMLDIEVHLRGNP